MRIWRTTDSPLTSATDKHHVYNGMDCCVTLEVWHNMPQLDEVTQPIYDQAMALHGPILEMNLRGVLVDKAKIATVRSRLEQDRDRVLSALNELIVDGCGLEPINPGSWQQVQRLLYHDLGINPIRKKGQVTSDRSALEKLRVNFWAEPLINHILCYRDLVKQIGVLKTGIDRDGRIRTSFAIAGTDTGRFASYESAFGTGTNLQNITPRLREIFIADPGYKFAYIDLEQAESRAVGAIAWNLFHRGEFDNITQLIDGRQVSLAELIGSPKYLDFCEGGDLHTNVAKMTFKNLPWGSAPDKEVASAIFYREFSHRESCKRLGHGSNYFGKAANMARETRIPQPLVADFQTAYFRSFPEIPAWHKWTRSKLIRDGWVTSLMGRRRWFQGRRWDDETLKQAIAYDPQGSVADIISRGILRIWKQEPRVQILLQIHDALLVQYPEELEDEVLPRIQRLMEVEVPLLNGRSLIIPTEAATGWNWGYPKKDKQGAVIGNVDGLVKYKGHDSRRRSAVHSRSVLDRKFHSLD